MRLLQISFVGMSGTGSGFLQVDALLLSLTLVVTFLAIVLAFRGGFPLSVLVASTPLVSRGSGIVVAIT